MTTEATLPSAGSQVPDRPQAVRGTWRQYLAALRVLLVLTALVGLVYPLAITAIAQLPGLHDRAEGSLVRNASGQVVGSRLIGQGFLDAQGNPLRQWFQPRPSAAGKSGWDGTSSGASNLGPTNPDLVKAITDRRGAIAAFDSVPGHPVAPAQVPPDAVTTSASGLDPDISPAYAGEQAYRVAAARSLAAARVLALVDAHTRGRFLGVVGEPAVNVLELNLALEKLTP
ncbi:MAG TPA: potassium-transporting ATPase subunit KdpC [Kineosporiaceae bacterium]